MISGSRLHTVVAGSFFCEEAGMAKLQARCPDCKWCLILSRAFAEHAAFQQSMIVPAENGCNTAITRRKIQTHAGAELTREFAVEFLPRSLVRRKIRLPGGTTLRKLLLRQQCIDATG